MVKQSIQIYLRIRPNELKFQKGEYEIVDSTSCDKLILRIPPDVDSNFGANNKKDNYGFKFSRIFDKDSTQESVFETVARPVVDNFLKGYNGTVFAYGQTGSGKTFTITGGAERYSDRGIIPRTLSYIFEYCNKDKSVSNAVQISYLEIYNENGYDLLDTKHDTAQKLEDLNKVTLFEDQNSNISLKNLSIHPSVNEEEALNLLFVGDTNRMVAETPMNQASTRSHCIFTIHLTTRQPDSAVCTQSKLHLVDLAGSERVYKTGVDGTLLTEAKYINLSLHYLEQVIVALSEKNRTHIPYRNSMMTAVLRDSLGGNCMTSMIATISVERRNLMESISTCRFSQRVALIKNEAILNEAVDPQLIIKQLRSQVEDLKSQLQLSDQSNDWENVELNEDTIRRCRNEVVRFLEENDCQMTRDIFRDTRKINLAFDTMKELYQKAKRISMESNAVNTDPKFPTIIVPDNPIATKEVCQLREIISQRDNEINILVSLLKKAKQDISERNHVQNPQPNLYSTFVKEERKTFTTRPDLPSVEALSRESSIANKSEQIIQHRILGDLSVGREEAFENFKNNYHLNNQIHTQKEELRVKYTEAKELGNIINSARETTNKLKTEIGKIRIQQAISSDPSQLNAHVSLAITDEEMRLRSQMDSEKLRYKDAYIRLKNLKTVIEHMQHLLETSKVKMMKDFEQWWQEEIKKMDNKDHNATTNRKPSLTTYPLINARLMSSSSGLSQSSMESGIPLTGDPKVDSDIQRFIAARNKLRQ